MYRRILSDIYAVLLTSQNNFKPKTRVKLNNEYIYDVNSDLAQDLNKRIEQIQYNSLNLPSKVILSDGTTVTYTYAVDGTKLRTVHAISGVTTTTDYCGNVAYGNNIAKLL